MRQVSSRLTRYLQRRPSGIYGFRYDIPARLRKVMGCRKIVRSLETRDLAEALQRLKPEVARARALIEAAELKHAARVTVMAPDPADPSADELLDASLDLLDALLLVFDQQAEQTCDEFGVAPIMSAALLGNLFPSGGEVCSVEALSASVRRFRRAIAEEVAADIRGRRCR